MPKSLLLQLSSYTVYTTPQTSSTSLNIIISGYSTTPSNSNNSKNPPSSMEISFQIDFSADPYPLFIFDGSILSTITKSSSI